MSLTTISLLGATGSIGANAVRVIRRYPERFRLVSVAAGRQWDKLLPLVEEFRLEKVCLWDEDAAREMRRHCRARIVSGMDGLLELAGDAGADFILNGLVGAIGCRPTLEAIARGKRVGLANKETMVMAGALINQALRANPRATLIPIDSEHSAVFQCLAQRPVHEVESIQLTASGGPFRDRPKAEFAAITRSQALKHPTWVMGEKITVDSATLMNKGLEVIEARFLFDVEMERIRVVVHPGSIVHSFVQFRDGSLLAQLGTPDMRLPIQYALTWPERWPLDVERLDLTRIGRLEFHEPDLEKFPCLGLAYKAGAMGGTAPAVLNAANEVAVKAFLEERLGFVDIPEIISRVLDEAAAGENPSLEGVLQADGNARVAAERLIQEKTPSHV